MGSAAQNEASSALADEIMTAQLMELTTTRLGKQYSRALWGLQDFSLRFQPGIIGLLGPNGAGKSTLMRMLATVSRPTAGSISWNGADALRAPDELRSVLGYLPQDFGIYPNLTAVEFLEYIAAIKGLNRASARRRIDALLETLSLTEARKRPLGGFSGGMRQRVGIAQALLNDPQVLIVDEPTVGLDPEQRVSFRNLLTDLAGNRIVILSTHIVSDVEATATDLAIINHGRLLRHKAPEAILAEVVGRVWEWTVSSAELQSARQRYLISNTIRRPDGLQLRVIADEPPDGSARAATPTLEDAYLAVIHEERMRQAA
jgi:ABC-type multidrug transport system ATPase subunit